MRDAESDSGAFRAVLRAGLGMADSALALLPESSMGFVGLARDELTFEPRAYMESLPGDLSGMPVLVLDPMLATGGSLVHCCQLLVDRGCTDITICCVLSAPEGIERLSGSGLPLRLVTASIDQGLNEKKYIVPGLGDASRAVRPFKSLSMTPKRATAPPRPFRRSGQRRAHCDSGCASNRVAP